MPTEHALLTSIQFVFAEIKTAYLDRKITLAEAYGIVKVAVQKAVLIATQYAQLTGEQKRQAVTEAAVQLCEFLLARTKLGALSIILRPIIETAVPVVVDLLIETWVSRAKVNGIGG